MALLTDHMREVAYEMFENEEPTPKVARRIRQTPASTAALRANWTRTQTSSRSRSRKR